MKSSMHGAYSIVTGMFDAMIDVSMIGGRAACQGLLYEKEKHVAAGLAVGSDEV